MTNCTKWHIVLLCKLHENKIFCNEVSQMAPVKRGICRERTALLFTKDVVSLKILGKKALALLAVCVMLFSIPSANALTGTLPSQGNISIAPMYINTESIAASLTFSGKTANCGTIVTGMIGTTEITATMTLYKVESSGSLTYQTSWSTSAKSDTLSYKSSYAVSSSGTYQLNVSANVYRSGKWESVSISVQKSCT